MASQPFAFPPPPPPPPKSATQQNEHAPRGRPASFRSSFLSAGPPRGTLSNVRGRVHGSNQNTTSPRGYLHPSKFTAQTPRVRAQHFESSNSAAPKRSHSAAFSAPPNPRSRPKAPPAVPSFNAGLDALLRPQPNKTNLLGLTPSKHEGSDSEDDKDEESRLGVGSGTDFQFEYKGQTSVLKTQAEIAAWVAERKRRWPTAAKREAARKEAEEKKRRWEESKKARAEAIEAAQKKRADALRQKKTNRLQPVAIKTDADSMAATKLYAEKLRRKALKVQRDLEAAEAALQGTEVGADGSTLQDTAKAVNNSDDDSIGSVSDSSVLSEDDTSSSESDADSESAPEALSSKVRVAALDQAQAATKRKLCQFFKKGRCNKGRYCPYLHETSQHVGKQKGEKKAAGPPKTKGLWQVMVEKEQEKEQENVLRAIITLGKQGLLGEHASKGGS